MEQTARLESAFRLYERTVPAARRHDDRKATLAAAAARVDLVLLLSSEGYDPEPEVTAQVRRDIQLICSEESAGRALL